MEGSESVGNIALPFSVSEILQFKVDKKIESSGFYIERQWGFVTLESLF